MPRRKKSSSAWSLSVAQLRKMLKTGESKLAQLRKSRDRFWKKLQKLDSRIASLGGHKADKGPGGKGKTGRRRATNILSLNEHIAQVLGKHGKPLKVGQIVQDVLASGYKTFSDNFRGIVNQALIKDKRFSKGGSRGSYKLKK